MKLTDRPTATKPAPYRTDYPKLYLVSCRGLERTIFARTKGEAWVWAYTNLPGASADCAAIECSAYDGPSSQLTKRYL